jgi:hypothetical protein
MWVQQDLGEKSSGKVVMCQIIESRSLRETIIRMDDSSFSMIFVGALRARLARFSLEYLDTTGSPGGLAKSS